MSQPLNTALADLRAIILDADQLIAAIASGRQRGAADRPPRAELRPVVIKAGRRLQIVRDDGTRPTTTNVAWGPDAEAAVDALLAEPFASWHVVTPTQTCQLRVTKRGAARLHRAARTAAGAAGSDPGDALPHDRIAKHLLDPGDPLFGLIGGTAAKRRQVDAFLRALAATLGQGDLPNPLTVVDLGCGNAYLTFAAFQYLSRRGVEVSVTGVDIRDDQRQRNTVLAQRLGCAGQVRFVAGTIADAQVEPAPDIVLSLHACDTATDEALARAVGWGSQWILAAPCCHHEIAEQLRQPRNGQGSRALLRDGILRQRFADVLTDAMRAALLRSHGYRVEVVEFVDSAHTPRNVLLRARGTGRPGRPGAASGEIGSDRDDDYQALATTWGVTPMLARLLDAALPVRPD
ncbi:MAG: SAM-dependent methyltransferase [Micromonosporaceae bacterium]|nr:SAM-dependent methyltransferase [Micromonosporaceae bacterium]